MVSKPEGSKVAAFLQESPVVKTQKFDCGNAKDNAASVPGEEIIHEECVVVGGRKRAVMLIFALASGFCSPICFEFIVSR